MGKTIFKEFIITILLLIAIVLIMMVIFYDYNPINKIVPEVEAYKTSEEIKNELDSQDSNFQLEKIEKTYSIDGVDLGKYKNSDLYVQGKSNPFASSNTITNNQTNNNTLTNTSGNNNNNNSNNNQNSTGTFFNNTGTK